MMNHQTLSVRSCGVLFLGILTTAAAHGGVVGYWRMENASSLGADSGPLGINLTPGGTATLTATGHAFGAAVPKTGAANLLAANFDIDNTNLMSVADRTEFAFQDFTIEAYINLASAGATSSAPRIIAGQLNTGSSTNQAWQLGVAGSGSSLGTRELFISIVATINGSVTSFGSASDALPAIEVGKNYYVAATVDFTAGSGVTVTRYLKNLTDGGDLLSATSTSTALSSLANSSTPFAIGASYLNGSAARHFDGALDEVRLSSEALPQSQLLVIPEPASGVMMLGSAALLAMRRKRQ